jgi:Na+-translocating ferredoxin:NAD+ oxidoreductase RnfG subunit
VDEAREHILRVFPGVESVVPVERTISPEEQEEIERSCGQPWADPAIRVLQAVRGDSLAGLAVIDNARGKDQPITYLLITDRDLTVRALEILAYREAYGGEVRAGAWRRQFEGKTPGAALRPGKEIKTISGATISSRSITLAVRRQLAALRVMAPHLRRTPQGTTGKDR